MSGPSQTSPSKASARASGMAVSSGGKLIVFNGGTDIDPTISSGGSGIVSAGGLILAQSGGTAEIDGFLTNSGALFASGASWRLPAAP